MPDRSGAIAHRADFSGIRYAQVWEDADILAEGLAVRPDDHVLSIASAGDNALALLAEGPASVTALDLSLAQLHCLALRVAAFRTLDHAGLLELVGSRPSVRRADLYAACRPALDDDARRFWDARPTDIAAGIGRAGKFERYLNRFRQIVLPLTQSRRTVDRLLAGGGTVPERRAWYDARWATWRWRALFRVAASRAVLGRGGRDPRFFDHVEGSVADRLMARARDAVTATDPRGNPYLHWILRATHGDALPRYLRPEHFEPIRDRLDRLTLRHASLEDVLRDAGPGAFTRFNLSDVFEYVDPAHAEGLFLQIADAARPGARVAYWNLLADRRPDGAARDRYAPLADLSARLHAADKAPFYSAFRVDEVA
jgi:S-adenosylmethionine-diacylglycerol 3-amino-3-carboxypropyl transferase